MQNLYERKVRYSFEETCHVVASTQEEADAKFDKMMEEEKKTAVGCSYGDLKAEVIANECVFEDN